MRVLAFLCLGLCIQLQAQLAMGSPARAQKATVAEGTSEDAPRLIRIGPQALVREDEHGRLTMVDEPAPDVTGTQVLRGILGVLGATAVLGVLLYDEGGLLVPDRPTFVR